MEVKVSMDDLLDGFHTDKKGYYILNDLRFTTFAITGITNNKTYYQLRRMFIGLGYDCSELPLKGYDEEINIVIHLNKEVYIFKPKSFEKPIKRLSDIRGRGVDYFSCEPYIFILYYNKILMS